MSLQFSYSFGYRNSRNSVAFYNGNTALFAAGKICVLFDLSSKSQSCFQFAERAEISALVRCGILIAAAIRGNPPSVCVFNTLSETKKFYTGPTSIESQEFTCLSVSVSLRFVAAQGGSPNWTLVVWHSRTQEVVAIFRPTGNLERSVHDVSFHAGGSDELVVVGSSVFKLYEYQEDAEVTGFVEHTFDKFEESATFYSICWPQKENLAVGTSEGEILFFRGIQLINEMAVRNDVGNLLKQDIFDTEQEDALKAVTSVVVTPQHLLCVYGGFVVLIYEGEKIGHYEFSMYILMPSEKSTLSIPGQLKRKPDFLASIVISPDGKDLIGTTREGQLLHCRGFTDEPGSLKFSSLLQRQHNEPVIGIDIARCRPVIATCSQHVAILWNYSNYSQELRQMFRNEISSVAVHPTGLYMALSFDYFCRIFSILYDGLRERSFIPCKNCSLIRFSFGGNVFAIVSGSLIEIRSFISSELLFKLDGHAALITFFEWKENDTKLVSCDTHGIVCEWNLVLSEKIWENTAVLSYLSVAVNPVTGNAVAVGSDKSVRCFDHGLVRWVLKTNKELTCILFSVNGDILFIGTVDGCLESYTYPSSNESTSMYAHSGKISGMKFNSTCDLLFSAGSDSFLFLWKTSEKGVIENGRLFSKLSLVDRSNLADQRNKTKQLLLSLQHNDIASDCGFELSCVKHEEVLRIMALNHEWTMNELNEKIARTKEEMQTILFDSDPKEDLKELEVSMRKEVISTTLKLNEAYKRSNAYANETKEIVFNYDNIMLSLTNKHAKFTSAEYSAIEEISEQIKVMEDTLVIEKGISEQVGLMCETYKVKVQKEVFDKSSSLNSSQQQMLDDEESKYAQLKHEIEKLTKLTSFKAEDTKSRRNITAGQVDYDLREKVRAVALLKGEYQKLESILEAKEKTVQSQEKKFYDMRKLVGDFQKRNSVSKTAIDELNEDIKAKQSEIESCRTDIKAVQREIPQLEEDIQLTEDLCSTVTEKLGETVDGFQRKQKMLRDTEDVMSKYTSMLHKCLSKSCDPVKLKDDILCLFEESKIGRVDETEDTRLLNEYDFQVKKLKTSYELIKEEPAKAMRHKSMAEFRLSQQNSKILREVHDVQKEAEKLRAVISRMENALGMQTAQPKVADDLRRKIEFVIDSYKKDKDEKFHEISKLDTFIEEQQKEIERFQTMLAAKLQRKE